MRLHRPPAGQRLQQRPGRHVLGPVARGRPAPSAPPRTRRRSSSRRRPGRSPARCRRRRAGTRSRRRRPAAGSPRGWRCGSTSRSRWRTRSAARGRSARSGCPASRAPSGNRSRTANAAAAHASTDGPERGHAAASVASGLVEVLGATCRRARRRGWRPPSRPGRRRSRPTCPVAPRQPPEPRGLGVRRVAARARRGRPSRRPGAGPAVQAGQGLVDRVVVQGLGERGVGVGGRLRPGVGAGVEGVGVRRRRRTARRRCRGRSGTGRPDVAGTAGSSSAAGRRDLAATPSANVQPRNAAPATPAALQAGGASREVHRVDPPAAQRARPGRQPSVELREGLDMDDARGWLSQRGT